jgi:predicted peptidase
VSRPRAHRRNRWSARAACAAALCLALAALHAAEPVVERVPDRSRGDAAAAGAIDAAAFARGEFRAPSGLVLPYRLLAPAHVAAGERYPLVLVLHGSGGIGRDNQGQLGGFPLAWAAPALRARYPAYVLVPQFPSRSADYAPSSVAGMQASHGTPALAAALALVEDFAARHPVDRARIYATGFSMGGSAAWNAVLARPDLFAAAMPVSAVAPDPGLAPRLRMTPLYVLHGDADPENPIASDRAMVAAIRRAGGDRVRLREYAGLDHRIPGDVFLGTWWRDWLFAQRKPAAAGHDADPRPRSSDGRGR